MRHACYHPGWNKSPEWRAIARAAILKHHAERHLLPRCGAKRKSTGTPCKALPARGRTRCRLHGGATPKGDGPTGWHTPAFPGGMPTGKPRSDAQKKRRHRANLERIEALTPDERARYDVWRVSHAPGDAAKRRRRRSDREAAHWLQDLMAEGEQTPAPPRRAKPERPLTLQRVLREGIGVFR